jgi:formamidopyrimidine-DNA glycosylase
MPELPEVQTVCARLDACLRDAMVERVRLLRADIIKSGARSLHRAMSGRRVRRVRRHGKRIIWEFDPPAELNFHLGMTGNLFLAARDAPLAAHTHLRISFCGRPEEVRFRDARRFGGVWLSGGRQLEASSGRFSKAVGPDALTMRLPTFRSLLERQRQIKALLMDQRVLAGLGNIYCDESLFRARIHPLTPASALDAERVADLLRSVRGVLRSAIAAGGSSLRDYRNADGEPGLFHVRHRVYGREGEPCPNGCGARIRRIVVASRSTHFCPRCQPERPPGHGRARRRSAARS